MRISDWSSDVCSSDLRVDNITQAVRVGTALPVRDVKRLTRLLCDKIETIEPGFGIEILTLTATIAEPIDSKQTVTYRSEERRGGKECVRTGRSRWSP